MRKGLIWALLILGLLQAHAGPLEEMGSALNLDPTSGNEVAGDGDGKLCETEFGLMKKDSPDAVNIYEVRETKVDIAYEDAAGNKQTTTASSLRFIFHFDNANTTLKPYQKNCLVKVLKYLKAKDQNAKQMAIVGYASSPGSTTINETISKKRAQSIWDQLSAVDPSGAKLVKVHGAGATDLVNSNYELIALPSTSNKTEDQQKSRRVEFKYSDVIDEKFFKLPRIKFLQWNTDLAWSPSNANIKKTLEMLHDNAAGLLPSKQVDEDYKKSGWSPSVYISNKKAAQLEDTAYTENRNKYIADGLEEFKENNNVILLDTWIMLYNMGFGADITKLDIIGHAAGGKTNPCDTAYNTRTGYNKAEMIDGQMIQASRGYIDMGKAEYGTALSYQTLSEARAKAVKDYFDKKNFGKENSAVTVALASLGKGCTDLNEMAVEIKKQDGTTTSTTIKK